MVEEFRRGSAIQSKREAAEHARRVEVVRQEVEAEIAEILEQDPDAEAFSYRMSDERPRTAAENLALIRDPRPTVMDQADERR